MNRRSFYFLVLVFSVVTLGLSGCGDGKVAVYPVTGKLLDAKGNPATGALVMFHPVTPPVDQPTFSLTGTANASGEYWIETYGSADGAPVGDYILTVVWLPEKKSLFDAQPDKLNGKYADKTKSQLKFKVEAKPKNEVPTITLK